MEHFTAISDLALKLSNRSQFFKTAVPRVSLHISQGPTVPIPAFYLPSVCLIAQGRKSIFIDGQTYQYGQGQYLVSGFDVPVVGSVTQASLEAPYVCVQISLNRAVIAEMLCEEESTSPFNSVIQIEQASEEFLSAIYRLLALNELPKSISALAPLREKEVLYWLLHSPSAMRLKRFAFADDKTKGVERAIAFLKENYAQPFDVDALLKIVGMSHSVFYRAFGAATGTSPLQYRMRLRLQEVRRLMLVENLSVSEAGFVVGYNNPSQLSREYRNLFGRSPSMDVKKALELLT